MFYPVLKGKQFRGEELHNEQSFYVKTVPCSDEKLRTASTLMKLHGSVIQRRKLEGELVVDIVLIQAPGGFGCLPGKLVDTALYVPGIQIQQWCGLNILRRLRMTILIAIGVVIIYQTTGVLIGQVNF